MQQWSTKSALLSHKGRECLNRFYRKGFSLRHASNSFPQSPEVYATAREWYKTFSASSSLNNIGEVTYSRSSGPGGQNVNKVNSKAQLRVPLQQLLPLVPQALHDGLKNSHYCAQKASSLLIQCDESRKQAANRDTCYRKLATIILDIYKQSVPGETAPEQQDRVKNLKRMENESRLRLKKYMSGKKASRKGGFE